MKNKNKNFQRRFSVLQGIIQSSQTNNQPSSCTSPRKNATFITQKYMQPFEKLLETHSQLNTYIDILDDKVKRLIEKHQSQFMVAYRNHIIRIRQEMQQLKNQALNNADSSMTHFQRIQSLEKQLRLFRDESIKLFDKITLKQKQMEQLKHKFSQLQSEKNLYQENYKILLKRNKYLEGLFENNKKILDFEVSINLQKNQMQTEKISKTRPYSTHLGTRTNSIKSRNQTCMLYQSLSQNQSFQGKDIYQNIRNILGQENIIAAQKIIKLLEGKLKQHKQQPISMKINRQMWNINKITKNREAKRIKSKQFAIKSELEQFFMQCIQSVRKQIVRRKQIRDLHFFSSNNISIQQFKKADIFRILQMVVSHQQITQGLFKIIFGENKKYF